MSRAARAALGAAALVGALFASGPAASAAGSGHPGGSPYPKGAAAQKVLTFGTQTASATNLDSRGYYDFAATPGGEVLDHVAVVNFSSQPITVAIQGTDGENDTTGNFVFRPVNQTSRDIGRWIEILKSDLNVTVAGRSHVIIPFLVVVPKNTSPGDHIGGITATLESSIVSKSGPKVHLLQTVGSEVYMRVSGPLHPRLVVDDLKAEYSGTVNPIGTGKAKVTYRVANKGNIALSGRQAVNVTGLFGSKTVAVRLANLPLLLPGYSAPVSVTLTGAAPELYEKAHVSIRPVPFTGSVAPRMGTYSGARSFWAIPWTLIAIVMAALVILALLLWRWRPRRRRPSEPEGETAPGDGSSKAVDVSEAITKPESAETVGVPGCATESVSPQPSTEQEEPVRAGSVIKAEAASREGSPS